MGEKNEIKKKITYNGWREADEKKRSMRFALSARRRLRQIRVHSTARTRKKIIICTQIKCDIIENTNKK